MKFIDPDGRQVGWPVNTKQWAVETTKQQYPPVASTWRGAMNALGRDIKSAVNKLQQLQPSSVSLTAEYAVGAGVEKTTKIAGTIITSGDDAGTLVHTQTESTGLNSDPEVSAALGIDVMYADKKDNFGVADLGGSSKEAVYTAKLKAVDLSVSVTTMSSPKAGNVTTYSFMVSKGAGGLKGLFKFTGVTIQNNETQIKGTTKDDDKNK